MPFDLKAVQKPLAGKPVWVWGLVGGIGVLGYFYWNSSHKAALAAAATTTTNGGAPANTATDTYPQTTNGSFTYGSPTDYTGSNVVADAGNTLGKTTLETNATWVNRGVIITGGGSKAKTALNAYLAGQPLTPTQAAYVREVKTVLGAAPETPSLAIQVIANAVPTPKTTNSSAKVNAAPKAPLIKLPKPKTKVSTAEQIKAGAADAAARAALSQTGNYTGKYVFNAPPASGNDFAPPFELTNPNATQRFL